MKTTKAETVKNIQSGKHSSTGKFWASCYSPRLGPCSQWGDTELDALKSLQRFVVDVWQEKWPEVSTNE